MFIISHGDDNIQYSSYSYQEQVKAIWKNLGISKLDNSYYYKLRDEVNNRDKIQIMFNNELYIKGYTIGSYEELQNLLESGAI